MKERICVQRAGGRTGRKTPQGHRQTQGHPEGVWRTRGTGRWPEGFGRVWVGRPASPLPNHLSHHTGRDISRSSQTCSSPVGGGRPRVWAGSGILAQIPAPPVPSGLPSSTKAPGEPLEAPPAVSSSARVRGGLGTRGPRAASEGPRRPQGRAHLRCQPPGMGLFSSQAQDPTPS